MSEEDVSRALEAAVARALAEDLAGDLDRTTVATVDPDAVGEAQAVARAAGVLAGTAALEAVYERLDERVRVELRRHDGDVVAPGDVVAIVRGPLRAVLTGERVALNLLGHLSGIATRTRAFVEAAATGGAVVRDTRKTTPGLRVLEKAAVRAGGGQNHRAGLHDALLVKDNHVEAAGSVRAAAVAARSGADGRPVQVEVRSLAELEEALAVGVDDILLDNFTPEDVARAVELNAGRAALEASGNITLGNVAAYSRTGVDRVAVGSITHSAPWLDIAMDVVPRLDADDHAQVAEGTPEDGALLGDEGLFSGRVPGRED